MGKKASYRGIFAKCPPQQVSAAEMSAETGGWGGEAERGRAARSGEGSGSEKRRGVGQREVRETGDEQGGG